MSLGNEERVVLLRLAREAVAAAARSQPWHPSLPNSRSLPAVLQQPSGAFVSLHKEGALRGCVGLVEPSLPLYQTVMEAAEAAALRDARFPAVRPEELPSLEIEISVLSTPQSLGSPISSQEIQIGLHGLIVTQGNQRGLLLPQVASERHWTAARFLDETCHKAGLPRDAWRTGARVEVFQAQVFSEESERRR
jgi:AmmeMemoRadiSam system protein A